MIEHAFKADPFGRDACDSKEDDADEGRVSHCGRPRSEHVDAEHGLRIQLVAALRERDDFKALNERSLERLDEAQEDLAAARRDLSDMDKLFLGTLAGILTAIPGDPEQIDDWLRTRIGRAKDQFDKARKSRALAAPAAGEEGKHG